MLTSFNPSRNRPERTTTSHGTPVAQRMPGPPIKRQLSTHPFGWECPSSHSGSTSESPSVLKQGTWNTGSLPFLRETVLLGEPSLAPSPLHSHSLFHGHFPFLIHSFNNREREAGETERLLSLLMGTSTPQDGIWFGNWQHLATAVSGYTGQDLHVLLWPCRGHFQVAGL